MYIIESLVNRAEGPYKENSHFETLVVNVKNTDGPANLASDYVGLLLTSIKNGGPALYRNKEIVSYGCLHSIPVDDTQKLSLPLTLALLTRIDAGVRLYLYPGDYNLALDIDGAITFGFTRTGNATMISAFPQNEANVISME